VELLRAAKESIFEGLRRPTPCRTLGVFDSNTGNRVFELNERVLGKVSLATPTSPVPKPDFSAGRRHVGQSFGLGLELPVSVDLT
jgi:hypothetical protein